MFNEAFISKQTRSLQVPRDTKQTKPKEIRLLLHNKHR